MTLPPISLTAPVGPTQASADTAPLLVLGPSLGTSTLLWRDVVPALARDHRVVAWDLPGHGAARPTTEPFSIADLADAVAEKVGEPFRYAGVSLGGCVGLELLLRHRDLVEAAAIVASGAVVGTPDGWAARAAQVRTQSTSSVISGSAQRWFAPGSVARNPDLTGRLLHALQDTDDESYALCCEALSGFDARERLGDIAAPVLAVWGAHDGVTPRSSAEEIAAGVQRGEAIGIADAAHLPPADDADATATVLSAFFSRIAAGAGA